MGNHVYNMMEQVYKTRFVILPRKNRLWLRYPIDQYLSSIEPPVQNEEGRWYSTSGGVTTENYIWVRHGTTWWIALWSIETLLRLKWVPTFKVECRRLGYVDDLRRQTHGRCYNERILEWCMGYSSQTRRKYYCILQMDIQLMKVSRSIKQDLWPEVSFRKRELILKRHLLQEARYTSFRTIMVVSFMMK